MKDEIKCAVKFAANICQQDLDSNDRQKAFCDELTTRLQQRFTGHWFESNPIRGQAFRCIHQNSPRASDPAVVAACKAAGVSLQKAPKEWTIWIDPGDVCARLGDGRIVRLDIHSDITFSIEELTTSSSPTTLADTTTTPAPGSTSPPSFGTSPRKRALCIVDPRTGTNVQLPTLVSVAH